MSTMPPNMPPQMQPQPPAPKKTSPLVWILGGVAVLFFGGMLTCGIVGYIAMRAVKNAGFDPDLMKRNPGIAMVKMATALNSNLELVSSNDRTGTVTMRDKTTGKTITYRFDEATKTLQIVGDNGEQMTFSGDGKNGSVTVKTADGTVQSGPAAGAAPAWVPVYPGASSQSTLSSQTKEGNTHQFTFKTGDAVGKVVEYYQSQLKGAGFNVTLVSSGDQGGMVSAEDGGKKRTIVVAVSASGGGSEGSVTSVEKP